jgi:hypothetical protein
MNTDRIESVASSGSTCVRRKGEYLGFPSIYVPHNIRMHLTGYSGLRPLPPAGDAGRVCQA